MAIRRAGLLEDGLVTTRFYDFEQSEDTLVLTDLLDYPPYTDMKLVSDSVLLLPRESCYKMTLKSKDLN